MSDDGGGTGEPDRGSKPDPAAAEASFEASTERLSRVVELLERGDLPLEKALALFEEGVRLARSAQARLDRAERHVEELLAIDPRGAPVTRPVSSVAGAGSEDEP